MTAQIAKFVAHEDDANASDAAGALEALSIIDLIHLSRQTLGDAELETELLALFQNQAQQLSRRLRGPSHPGDDRWRVDLAHTLKGSARAVGAFRVAQAAEDYEMAIRSRSGNLNEALRRLLNVIDETQAEIAGLLERS